MAKKVEELELRLGVAGAKKIKNLSDGFKDFYSTLKQGDVNVTKFIKEIGKVHKNTKLSVVAQKGQVAALKEVQNRVGDASKAWFELNSIIKQTTETQKKANQERWMQGIMQEGKGRDVLLAEVRAALPSRDKDLNLVGGKGTWADDGMTGLMQQIQNIGLSKVTAGTERLGQTWQVTRQQIVDAGLASRETTQAIKGKVKATTSSTNALNAQRAAFVELRNGLAIGSQGYRQLTKDIQRAEAKMRDLTKFSGKNMKGAMQGLLGATFVGGGSGLAGGLIGGGIEAMRKGGDIQSGVLSGGLVGSQLIQPVSEFIGGTADYAAQIDKLKISLRGVAKDQASYNIAIQAAERATKEFNIPQEIAIRGITRMSAAVIGAGGNMRNAEEAFLNTVAAIKGTAGSADDVKSALTAMIQIYSKGKVSAEELSGQLGERFPGAVVKFAKANNIQAKELQEQLKNGTVGLDMLSKFITSLGDEYIPLAQKIGKSQEEAGARAGVAMRQMKYEIGKQLKGVGAEFQEIAAKLAVDLIPLLRTLAQIGKVVFGALAAVVSVVANNIGLLTKAVFVLGVAFTTLKIQALIADFWKVARLMTLLRLRTLKFIAVNLGVSKIVKAWKLYTGAIIKATTVQAKFNAVIAKNPYVALATVVASLIVIFGRFGDKTQEAKDKYINSLAEMDEAALKQEIKNKKRELSELRAGTDRKIFFQAEIDDESIKKPDNLVEKEDKKTGIKFFEAPGQEGGFNVLYRKQKEGELRGILNLYEQVVAVEEESMQKTKFNRMSGKTLSKEMMKLREDLLVAEGKGQKIKALTLKKNIEILKIEESIKEGAEKTATEKHKISQIEKQYEVDKTKLLQTEDQMLFKLGLITEEELKKRDIAREAAVIFAFQNGLLSGQKYELEEIKALLAANKDGLKDWQKKLKEVHKDALDLKDNLKGAVVDGVLKIGDAFADLLVDGKASFKELTVSILKDIQKMIIKAILFQTILAPLKGWLGFEKGGVVSRNKVGSVGDLPKVYTAAKGAVIGSNNLVPFYSGGIVKGRKTFPMANGATGLVGEAGQPEAIMPLKRNRKGVLGVATSGSGGGSTVVNVAVDAKGTKASGDGMQAKQLGKLVGTAVEAELIKQKRPGGILYS